MDDLNKDLERAEVELDAHIDTGQHWRLLWSLLILTRWRETAKHTDTDLSRRLRDVFNPTYDRNPLIYAQVCSCRAMRKAATEDAGLYRLLSVRWQAGLAHHKAWRQVYLRLIVADPKDLVVSTNGWLRVLSADNIEGKYGWVAMPALSTDQHELERQLRLWLLA